MPVRVIRPRVGLMLNRLFALAGLLSELTVSVPEICQSMRPHE